MRQAERELKLKLESIRKRKFRHEQALNAAKEREMGERQLQMQEETKLQTTCARNRERQLASELRADLEAVINEAEDAQRRAKLMEVQVAAAKEAAAKAEEAARAEDERGKAALEEIAAEEKVIAARRRAEFLETEAEHAAVRAGAAQATHMLAVQALRAAQESAATAPPGTKEASRARNSVSMCDNNVRQSLDTMLIAEGDARRYRELAVQSEVEADELTARLYVARENAATAADIATIAKIEAKRCGKVVDSAKLAWQQDSKRVLTRSRRHSRSKSTLHGKPTSPAKSRKQDQSSDAIIKVDGNFRLLSTVVDAFAQVPLERVEKINSFRIPFSSSDQIRNVLRVPANTSALVRHVVSKLQYNETLYPRQFCDLVLTSDYKRTAFWTPRSER